jgi:hypothetical protein
LPPPQGTTLAIVGIVKIVNADRCRETEKGGHFVSPQTDTVEPEVISEHSKVESWRLHVLIEASYPLYLAERLAAASDVDLHCAVELVSQGCKHATAAEILL